MRHKSQLLCLVLISTILFTGCTTLAPKVHLNSYRLENPEVASTPLKVNIATGIVTDTELTVQDTTEDNIDGAEIRLLGKLGVTLAKGLQFSLSHSRSDRYRLSGKYQFYGDNADLATQGNFSQAISLGYSNGVTAETERTTSEEVYNAGNYLNWELTTHTVDIAWILGYRLTDNVMLYGGPFVGYSMSKGTRFKDSPQFEKTLNLSGYMPGANLVFEYRFDMGLALSKEVLIYTNQWEGGKYSFSSHSFNFKIDYQF
jgi:hypothetical protein